MYIYFAVVYKWNKRSCNRLYLDRIPCVDSFVAEDVRRRLVRLYSSTPNLKFDIERVDVLESIEDFESELPF